MEVLYCYAHLGKRVFRTEEHAHIYMRIYHPDRTYRIYPCPENSNHFHVQNKTKVNQRRAEQRKRAKARAKAEKDL